MQARRLLTRVSILSVAVLALVACRSEEQGRVLTYQPGTYLGKPDTTRLSNDQRAVLSERARLQRGTTGIAIGGGSGRQPDTAKPTTGTNVKALRERGRQQRGSVGR